MRLPSISSTSIAASASAIIVAGSILVALLHLFPGVGEAFSHASAEPFLRASAEASPYSAGLAGALALLVYFRMRTEFKTHHDIPSLAEFQQSHWRTLTPTHGSLAASLNTQEFLAAERIAVEAGVLDRGACTTAMVKQLGEAWPGLLPTPPHVKSLAVIAAVHGLAGSKGIGRKDGLKLRQDLAEAYSTITDRRELEEAIINLIRRYVDDKAVINLIEKLSREHHYTATALMRLVEWARHENGVLPCAEFLWLKGVDRPLWYALNNVGRRSFHIEGAGAVAHYRAEKTIRSPLATPRVEKAVDGVEGSLGRVKLDDKNGGTIG